jgi:hypothetical protein
LVVRLTLPASYTVFVVAFSPPVSVLPDRANPKSASPVGAMVRFPAVPALTLVSLMTAPLAVALTGDPLAFRAVTKSRTKASSDAPAGYDAVALKDPTVTETVPFSLTGLALAGLMVRVPVAEVAGVVT